MTDIPTDTELWNKQGRWHTSIHGLDGQGTRLCKHGLSELFCATCKEKRRLEEIEQKKKEFFKWLKLRRQQQSRFGGRFQDTIKEKREKEKKKKLIGRRVA